MIRLGLWALAGVVLGALVHLLTVLLLPRLATQDAYARLAPITPVNAFALLPDTAPQTAPMPFMDPAFAVAVCRYDLSKGPIKLSAPVSQAYTSATFYTRYGVAYYAVNDRAAGRRAIELDLMTAKQRNDLQEDEEVTAADRLIVESRGLIGLIVLRALSPEPGAMALTRENLAAAKCGQQS